MGSTASCVYLCVEMTTSAGSLQKSRAGKRSEPEGLVPAGSWAEGDTCSVSPVRLFHDVSFWSLSYPLFSPSISPMSPSLSFLSIPVHFFVFQSPTPAPVPTSSCFLSSAAFLVLLSSSACSFHSAISQDFSGFFTLCSSRLLRVPYCY